LDRVRHELSFIWLFGVNHHAVADAQVRQLGGSLILAECRFRHDSDRHQFIRGGLYADGVLCDARDRAKQVWLIAVSKRLGRYEREAAMRMAM
jgi:hypothetical protein